MAILASTYHVQDFKDYEGDLAVGRKTFAIVMPNLARQEVFAALTTWTLGLAYLWELGPSAFVPFCSLGFFVGLRFYMLQGSRREDQKSFYWYNVRQFHPKK
jgi:4-hydroxybenzoate polyprenyltransferase